MAEMGGLPSFAKNERRYKFVSSGVVKIVEVIVISGRAYFEVRETVDADFEVRSLHLAHAL